MGISNLSKTTEEPDFAIFCIPHTPHFKTRLSILRFLYLISYSGKIAHCSSGNFLINRNVEGLIDT